MVNLTLADLANQLGAELNGDGTQVVSGINNLADASGSEISFLSNKKFRSQLETTQALAVIVSPQFAKLASCATLVMDDPYLGYALAAQALDPKPIAQPGIHPSAVVDASAEIGSDVHLGPGVVVEAGAKVGKGSVLEANSFVGAGAELGEGVKLRPNVTIYHGVVLGDRVCVHANTAIGCDGFGFANDKGRWVKIPQLGRVVVGNDADIGASVTIDRGAIDDTVIGPNVIIDNQVHIAHNCTIGEGSAIAGTTGIAGSTNIGKYCIIGGSVVINGHIDICDQVQITGNSMVVKSITEPGVYSSGMPAVANREWRKGVSHQQHLGELYKRVKSLEAKLAEDS